MRNYTSFESKCVLAMFLELSDHIRDMEGYANAAQMLHEQELQAYAKAGL